MGVSDIQYIYSNCKKRHIHNVHHLRETLKVCSEHSRHSTQAPFVTHTMSKEYSSSIHVRMSTVAIKVLCCRMKVFWSPDVCILYVCLLQNVECSLIREHNIPVIHFQGHCKMIQANLPSGENTCTTQNQSSIQMQMFS